VPVQSIAWEDSSPKLPIMSSGTLNFTKPKPLLVLKLPV